MAKVSEVHKYEQGIDAVYAMMTSADYFREKYAHMGARDVSVTGAETPEGGHSIESTREVDSDVPSILSKVLGKTNTVNQIETWDAPSGDPRTGTWKVHIVGQRVTVDIDGTYRLVSEGGGAALNIDAEVKAKAPLALGGPTASFAAGETKKNMSQEYEFNKGWVASH